MECITELLPEIFPYIAGIPLDQTSHFVYYFENICLRWFRRLYLIRKPPFAF